MSFGDDSKGPVSGMLSGVFSGLDEAMAPAFGFKGKKDNGAAVPKPTPSLINAPSPQSVDTPGRHKTLLGA